MTLTKTNIVSKPTQSAAVANQPRATVQEKSLSEEKKQETFESFLSKKAIDSGLSVFSNPSEINNTKNKSVKNISNRIFF